MSTQVEITLITPPIEVRHASIGEVEDICKSGDLEKLIGIIENQHIEFKQQLDLNLAKDRHKLVKSIASFANTDGGIVLIGVTRAREGRTRRDYAGEIRYLEGDFDIGTYYKLVNNLLYPAIAVQITRHPSSKDPQLAIVSVRVNKALSDQPILVTETNSENLNGGSIFGYYRRDEEGTNHVKHGEVHALLQAGERLKEIGDLKEAVKEILDCIQRIETKLAVNELKGQSNAD